MSMVRELFIGTCVVIMWSLVIPVKGYQFGTCSVRLNGGNSSHEGILQVKLNNTDWFYVCEDETMMKRPCNIVHNKYVSSINYGYESDFMYNGSIRAISIRSCDQGAVIKNQTAACTNTNTPAQCCKIVKLCCNENPDKVNSTTSCRHTWKEAVFDGTDQAKQQIGGCYRYNEIATVRYLVNVTTFPILKSWTASAFIAEMSESAPTPTSSGPDTTTIGLHKDVVDHLNKCLQNIANCLSTQEKLSHCAKPCSVDLKNYAIVDRANISELIEVKYYCIAVEGTGGVGSAKFTVEKCNTLLPAFCGLRKKEQPDDHSDDWIIATTVKVHSTTLQPSTTASSSENTEHYIWVAFGVIVFVLFGIMVAIRILCRREGEKQRPNSFSNRGYAQRPLLREEDETYAQIQDGDHSFRPELPARVRGNTTEITTPDEYAEPSDTLRQSPQQAEYLVTYDDPIRMFVKNYNRDEKVVTYDVNNLSEARAESFKLKNMRTPVKRKNNSLIVNGHIGPVYDENSDTTDELNAYHCFKKEYTCSESSLSSGQLKRRRSTEQESDKDEKEYDINEDKIPLSESGDNTDDYEDTSVTGWQENKSINDGKSSCQLFEKHVCLDCLTSEHCKKLGIRIVSDDNLYHTYRYTNWPRRFSDSDLHLYVNRHSDKTDSLEMDRDDKQNVKIEHKTIETHDHGDSRASIGTSSSSVNTDLSKLNCDFVRKCSVCNADFYDTLEQFKQKNWNVTPDNVYNKIKDVRFWHTRKHEHRCVRIKSSY